MTGHSEYLQARRTLATLGSEAALARPTPHLSLTQASGPAPGPRRLLVRRAFARLPVRTDALVDGAGYEGAERLVWRAFDRDDDVLVVARLPDDLVHRHVVRVRGT